MKLGLFFIIALELISLITCNKVIVVNDKDYEEYIANNEYVLIYFHATWSNDSKNIRMHYLGLPQTVRTDKKIAYLETTNKSVLMNYKYDIKTYPTILLINKDKHFIYRGNMKTKEISEWIENKISKRIEEIESLEEIEKIFEKFHAFSVYVGEINNYYEEFIKATESFQDSAFFRLSNLTLIENLNIKQEIKNLNPKVLIFKTFDDDFNLFSPKNLTNFNSKNIEHFIKSYSLPALNGFSPNNHIYVVNNKIEFTILVVNSNKTIDFNQDIHGPEGLQIYKDFYAESLKYRGKLFFMIANISDISQTTISHDFEFDEKDLPILIINGYNPEKTRNERYKSTPEDINDMVEFYEKYKYKALSRFFKGEDLPKNPYSHYNVYKLVRKNFNELVINNDKNFLVYLVRRNCGLCNEYLRAYLDTAKYYNDLKDFIEFGILDGLANEFEDFENLTYPSVLLFKRGTNKLKNYIIYDYHMINELELDRFIKIHTKIPNFNSDL